MLVPVEDVRNLAESICSPMAWPGHARTQAGLFLEAEMRAIPSHGLLRLRRVIERLRAGLSVGDTDGDQRWTAGISSASTESAGLAP